MATDWSAPLAGCRNWPQLDLGTRAAASGAELKYFPRCFAYAGEGVEIIMRALLLIVLLVAGGQAVAFEAPPRSDAAIDQPPSSTAPIGSYIQRPPHQGITGPDIRRLDAEDQVDAPFSEESPPVGSAAILSSCWTTEQLAGTDPERTIRMGLAPDRKPPPDWAVRSARESEAPLASALRGSIRSVEPADPKARLVALTFDLCQQAREQTGYDGRIIDWLRGHRIPATFFAGGEWLRTHPERAMQLMADPLFELGNHGWTHLNLRTADAKAARQQLVWTQAEYQVIRQELHARPCAAAAGPAQWERIPEWPRVMRFPYGACNGAGLDLTASLGLPAIQWSVVSGDPDKKQSAQAIARSVIARVERERGAIVVAHANGRGWHTAEALPDIVEALTRRGYRFLTMSGLLAEGKPLTTDACYEMRPGDNLRYDYPKRNARKHWARVQKPASQPPREQKAPQ